METLEKFNREFGIMEKRFQLYRTSDLYFASYLSALDITLEASETEGDSSSRKVVFVFRLPMDDLNRLKASYFGGSGTVKARKFVDSLRSLKSLCHT
jgi:hypothetical protein